MIWEIAALSNLYPHFKMNNWQEHLLQERLIAVLRVGEPELAIALGEVLIQAGIRLLEVTWNMPEPALLVRHFRKRFPQAWIGAGTILNETMAAEAIAAEAQFIFTPHTDPSLIRYVKTAAVPIIPGALTPTEILKAWQGGATCVKVFPIGVMGGARYLRDLQGPFAGIPLIPTGGVTLENAPELIQAGAIALGVGSDLMAPEWVATQNWLAIQARVKRFRQVLGLDHLEHPDRPLGD